MLRNLDLVRFGWDHFFEDKFHALQNALLIPARVIEELKNSHRVRTAQGEFLAEIAGKIRFHAESRDGLPAVGDWVAVTMRPQEHRARIEHVLPRRTKLSRKVAGREVTEQIVATNLDTVFVVSALNREFNPRRIERYLALVWESGAKPVVLLNKADLCPDVSTRLAEIQQLALGVPVHQISALEADGLDALSAYLTLGKTAAFVGSSGVGKTTIISALAGNADLKVRPVRKGDDRGRHTTTSRQMIFLPDGGIVIDTPGMRELQLWNNEEGIAQAFDDIASLALDCRFRDCSHQGEPGCAVEAAIVQGRLDRDRLENHFKLLGEQRFQQRKLDPRVASEAKARWKKIHKAMRDPRFPY